MSCDEHHCITCSDDALETRVLSKGCDGLALCESGEVLTDLVGQVEKGDLLLVHAGVAIARLER